MKSSILANLDSERQGEIRGEFVSSRLFRERIIEMLEKDIQGYYDSMGAKDAFLEPNFAMVQAERLGRINECKKIIALLQN